MESRIMQVFYGNDLLPYKDKERTVHYPITNGAIAGSNNVTKIRFYVDQIGGTESVSWVVVSKLPNGKLGYEPISNVGIDDETGEKYLEFDLSSYYTSVKGDLYLALRGYQGDIEFEDKDDDGIYKIVGDPLIQVTGTIKLPINYSPMVNTGTQVLPTDVDRLIASLSDYLKVGDGIQIFTATNTTTFAQLYAQTGTKEFILFYNNTYYIGRFNSATSIYMETISRISNSKITYSNVALTTSDRVATLFSYNNEDRVAFGKTTIWYTYGSDTTDFDHLLQDLDYNGGHDSTKPFIFKLTGSSYGYEGYYLCQADTMGYPNCHFIFREIDGNKIFKGVVASYQTNDLRDFFNPNYLSTQTTEEYVDDQVSGVYDYVNEYFLKKDVGGNVEGDVAFGGIVTVVTPTQDNEVANKGYVDNAIQEFLQNEFQAVDTTEYPTLDSFLASTGEEGYIYLYPTGVNNDYYQYIWEGSWVSLGTTQLDLSNYYTKSETDTLLNAKANASDVYTKSQTDSLLGNKQDTLISGTNIKTLNNESLLGSGNISYDNALSSSSTNAVQNKVITQNVLDLQYRVSLLEEAIISEDTLSYTYLSESLIPTLSDNSYPIIQSGGLDTKEIKGRSFVYNQIKDISNITNGTLNGITWTNYNNEYLIVSGTATAGTGIGSLSRNINLVSGHKYLCIGCPSGGSNTTYQNLLSPSIGSNIFDIGNGAIYICNQNETAYYTFYVRSGTTLNNAKVFLNLFDLTQSGIDSATTVDEAIALLQQNGINPYEYNEYNVGKIIDSKPTAIVSIKRKLPQEYQEVEYIAGTGTQYINALYKILHENIKIKIKYKVDSGAARVFGARVYPQQLGFCLFKSISSASISFGWNATALSLVDYILDNDVHEIELETTTSKTTTIKVDGNVVYSNESYNGSVISNRDIYIFNENRLASGEASLGEYLNGPIYYFQLEDDNQLVRDFVPCYRKSDNVIGFYDLANDVFYTNAGTGTFLKGKDTSTGDIIGTYPLDVPVMRSAGSMQDNNLKVNIGSYTFTGNESWVDWIGNSRTLSIAISNMKKPSSNSISANIMWAIGITVPYNNVYSSATQEYSIAVDVDSGRLYVRTNKTQAELRTATAGKTIYFELANSTDQPSITLPKNIEFELGGSLEVLYDDGHTTPCDFVFDTAVYKPIQ